MQINAPDPKSLPVPPAQSELVFALVVPLGVDADPTIAILVRELMILGYSTKTIYLNRETEIFLKSEKKSCHENKFSQLGAQGRMQAQEKYSCEDTAAQLGITEISRLREQEFGSATGKRAYILYSLKYFSDAETLAKMYGRYFFLISIYLPMEMRLFRIAEEICRLNGEKYNINDARIEASSLIENCNIKAEFDKNIRDIFSLVDLFVDCRSQILLDAQICRFLRLLFKSIDPIPTRDEYGMYCAWSAQPRSAHRQKHVGAAVLRPEGDLITVGCNGRAKAGGDLYWPGATGNLSDFLREAKATEKEKALVLSGLFQELNDSGFLSQKFAEQDLTTLVNDFINGDKRTILENTRLISLLTWDISVHAEMAVLMSSARLGVSVQDAYLFVTFFPCHECAKNIIASGIKRIVYLEPYLRSKTKQFYPESIIVEPTEESADHVTLEPFIGVSPKQYRELFGKDEKIRH